MHLPLQTKWCSFHFLLCVPINSIGAHVFKKGQVIVWYTVFSGLCGNEWKLVSLNFQVNDTVFPFIELQLTESFLSIRETENRSSKFSITTLYVPFGYWKNWDMSVKYSRQNNMRINQWLEAVSKMLFIARFSSNMHYSNDRHITKTDTLEKNYMEVD